MDVTIDGIEVSGISAPDLALLLRELKKSSPKKGQDKPVGSGQKKAQKEAHQLDMSHQDGELLKRFVAAGDSGVLVTAISELLQKRGKAIRTAISDWAIRTGLITDKAVTPWEITRIGTQRAYRLRETFRSVAQSILDRSA